MSASSTWRKVCAIVVALVFADLYSAAQDFPPPTVPKREFCFFFQGQVYDKDETTGSYRKLSQPVDSRDFRGRTLYVVSTTDKLKFWWCAPPYEGNAQQVVYFSTARQNEGDFLYLFNNLGSSGVFGESWLLVPATFHEIDPSISESDLPEDAVIKNQGELFRNFFSGPLDNDVRERGMSSLQKIEHWQRWPRLSLFQPAWTPQKLVSDSLSTLTNEGNYPQQEFLIWLQGQRFDASWVRMRVKWPTDRDGHLFVRCAYPDGLDMFVGGIRLKRKPRE